MASFIGQIELFAFDSVPPGWAKCDGSLVPINRNQALFALLGTSYGGDGRINFALPDLRGRVPIGLSQPFMLGQRSGEEAHTLSTAEMPAHAHMLMADAVSPGTGHVPAATAVLGRSSGMVAPSGPAFTANLYAAGSLGTSLNDGTVMPVGTGRPHENRMPSLALNFCICIDPHAPFPPRNRTVLGMVRSVLGSVSAPFRKRG